MIFTSGLKTKGSERVLLYHHGGGQLQGDSSTTPHRLASRRMQFHPAFHLKQVVISKRHKPSNSLPIHVLQHLNRKFNGIMPEKGTNFEKSPELKRPSWTPRFQNS